MTDAAALRLLFDRHRLARLRRALGRDASAFAVERDPDPALVDPVADPFESPADALSGMETLESRLLDRSDRRSVFLSVYTEMTAETIAAIDDGAFREPDWMRRYLVAFADRYRRAFLRFERGDADAVPDPWTVAFGVALRGDALVLQDALLGVNAHVNYDLALTLSEVGTAPRRAAKRADHDRVNAILERLVSVQQDLLAERYASELDRIGERLGDLDDRFAGFAFEVARGNAWGIAVVRSDARLSLVDAFTRWLLGETATGGAFVLLAPGLDEAVAAALSDAEATADGFDLATLAGEFHDRA